MIKKVEVIISFPIGAKFKENLNEWLYRSFFSFLHRLLCFQAQSKCIDCSRQGVCRYYEITGQNFSAYPGILIQNRLFEKSIYAPKEQRAIIFYFVGDNEVFSDYVDLYFEHLNQTICGNFFCLKAIKKTILEEKMVKLSAAYLTTPIEHQHFTQAYNDMVSYYNNAYQTDLIPVEKDYELKDDQYVCWKSIRLKTRRITVKGYVGELEVEINIDSRILETGVGRYNYLGGGCIEA